MGANSLSRGSVLSREYFPSSLTTKRKAGRGRRPRPGPRPAGQRPGPAGPGPRRGPRPHGQRLCPAPAAAGGRVWRWAPELALRPPAAPVPWPCGPGRAPAVRGPGRGLRPRPALRFIVKQHLLIYDVHMYQCIDIHWRFFLRVA